MKIKYGKHITDIRAAFFDIDGTYFDQVHGQIPPANIDAVRRLQENGFKVALASARPYSTTMEVEGINSIQWDGLVCAGGQQVYDAQKRLLYEDCFSRETLHEIFDIAQLNQIPVYAVGTQTFYTMWNTCTAEFHRRFHLPDIPVRSYQGESIQLITLIMEKGFHYEPYFEKLPDVAITYSGDTNTDLFPAGVTKATGIHQLMKLWGFPIHDYLCFGDTRTDIPMLEDACLGIAMGNAEKEVMLHADAVCACSDCNGIPNFLRDCFLI